jgi:hypothetical protein
MNDFTLHEHKENDGRLLNFNCSGAGENFIKSGQPAKARSAAVLAREVLSKGAATDELTQRLEALDAEITAANKTLQWRQMAHDEADGALKCVQLSEVSAAHT